MQFRVTLTDTSEFEVEAINWTAAAREARIWHEEVSQSADYTEWSNPVQIKSIVRIDIEML